VARINPDSLLKCLLDLAVEGVLRRRTFKRVKLYSLDPLIPELRRSMRFCCARHRRRDRTIGLALLAGYGASSRAATRQRRLAQHF
jgi:hypothetical protein